MVFVKRVLPPAPSRRRRGRAYAIGAVLVVLIGGLIGFAYQSVEDAHHASEASAEPEPATPAPPEPKETLGSLEATKSLQIRQQEELGLKWVENGDKAAVDGLTDLALTAYKTGLAYLEGSGGCQSTMAKAVRAKIANVQKKPYDLACAQAGYNAGTKGK
jgi:hypothetical protein